LNASKTADEMESIAPIEHDSKQPVAMPAISFMIVARRSTCGMPEPSSHVLEVDGPCDTRRRHIAPVRMGKPGEQLASPEESMAELSMSQVVGALTCTTEHCVHPKDDHRGALAIFWPAKVLAEYFMSPMWSKITSTT
jgi:hypothetical protein